MPRVADLRRLLVAVVSVASIVLSACTTADGPSPAPPDESARPVSQTERLTPAPDPRTAPDDERPNLILITADDMRADEMRYLPQTQRLLGDRGMVLTEALTPHPLCCPARAMLMTGQYAHNNGVRSNAGPQGGYKPYDSSNSLATWLHDAGYNTAMVGKHLNAVDFSKVGREPGWTIFDPAQGGYSDYVDYSQYNDGVPTYVRDTHFTDYVGAKSAEYAHRLSGYEAPFFMWVSHFGPHSTMRFNCRDETLCEGKKPPTQSEVYLADTARVVRDAALARERTDRLMETRAFRQRNRSDKQHYVAKAKRPKRSDVLGLVRGRIGALTSVDDAIAGLVAQLEADDELDNTYLVFITDNGYLLGEFGYIGKVVGYEPSIRTPMLVRGPSVLAGSDSADMVSIIDIVPTFLELAEATPTLRLDGASMTGVWDGSAEGDIHPGGVLIQAGAVPAENGRRGWYYRGVRTERYTYMKFFDGTVELYDLRRDPQQLRSVARQRAYQRVRKELARRTRRLQACEGPRACNRDFGPMPAPRQRGKRR